MTMRLPGWATAAVLTVALGDPSLARVDLDEPLPLRITSVVPVFCDRGIGPEFEVTVVNEGKQAIPMAVVLDSLLVEHRGTKYEEFPGAAVFRHVVPAAIGAGEGRPIDFRVGGFGVSLEEGRNTVTLYVGGVSTAPVSFLWRKAAAASNEH